MKNLTTILIALALFCQIHAAHAVDTLPYYSSEDFTPHWFSSHAKVPKNFHRVPVFSFINQDGKQVNSADFKDKIYVASFFFTLCPGICPTLTTKLSVVQKTYANDERIRIISHSVTPTIDTVEVLRRYADKHHIHSDKWDLLTGSKADMFRFVKTAYFASEDLGKPEENDDFLHSEKLLLIDSQQRIRGVYNGMADSAIDDLIADINSLKAEIDQ